MTNSHPTPADRQDVATLIATRLEGAGIGPWRVHVFQETEQSVIRLVTRDLGTFEITVKEVIEQPLAAPEPTTQTYVCYSDAYYGPRRHGSPGT